jgi:hypothetical protein
MIHLFKGSGGKPPSQLRIVTFVVIICTVFVFLVTCVSVNAQESATRERRASNAPAAQATVTVNEQFLNSFLQAIFDNLSEPSISLSSTGQSGCASEIRLKREVAGVRTAVHFENGRVVGPLAFSGTYSSSLLGCIAFSGWADSEVNLSFDAQRQALVARFNLRNIHLNDVPSLANGPVLNVVQNTIDRRYNPVELLTLEQLSARVNVQPAGGALRLRATHVRPEITPAALALHITYEVVKG